MSYPPQQPSHHRHPPDDVSDDPVAQLRAEMRAHVEDMRIEHQQVHIDHERRIAGQEQATNMLMVSQHAVAKQIAELAVSMQNTLKDMPTMVASGLRDVLRDSDTWRAAKEGMRAGAQQAAGGAVMKALGWVFDKAVWTLIGIVAIYALGGMPALLAVLKMTMAGDK